jgi:hypothetical protein
VVVSGFGAGQPCGQRHLLIRLELAGCGRLGGGRAGWDVDHPRACLGLRIRRADIDLFDLAVVVEEQQRAGVRQVDVQGFPR